MRVHKPDEGHVGLNIVNKNTDSVQDMFNFYSRDVPVTVVSFKWVKHRLNVRSVDLRHTRLLVSVQVYSTR